MKLIAEFGVNWNTIQDFRTMILFCTDLGINMVKMQLFKPDQVPEDVRKFYIGKGRAKYFFNFAKEHGIDLFFTCMYPEAVDMCQQLGVKYYKVRYFDNRNLTLYRKLKNTNQDLFISCTRPEDTLFFNMSKYQKRVHFLYCVPRYPARTEDYLSGLIDNYKIKGVSDHTNDLTLFEFCKGCNTIDWFEMHVCLDKKTAYEGDWAKELGQLKEVL